MSTPYLEELALTAKTNEGIDEIIYLTERVGKVDVPLDLTGRTFFAQARRTKAMDGELICDISATVYGPPEDGAVRLIVQEDVIATLDPVKGHYDVLTRAGDSVVNNLYMAPFVVEGGVSRWL